MATAAKKHGDHKHPQRNLGAVKRLDGAELHVVGYTEGHKSMGHWDIGLFNPTPHGKDCVGQCNWRSQVPGSPTLSGRFRYNAMNKQLELQVANAKVSELAICLTEFNLHAQGGRGLSRNTAGDDNAAMTGLRWGVKRWGHNDHDDTCTQIPIF